LTIGKGHRKYRKWASTGKRRKSWLRNPKRLRYHNEIKKWVEGRGGRPIAVKSTGGGEDAGILRIDFPGFGGGAALEEISWEEFFRKFEENKPAFLYQEETAGGEKSNFNKFIKRT